eukprot:CAMPEP_0170061986 /NCGR_PEP_ID=MMETSP0019_2-20121128/3370_1 /TAXON_ID=98059 /ORGANISM="Dinobryon sp., Strain UTEXLB2267" /LENGTH=97 /DNA_ID=CAMNT_0010267997 /DNA_START=163 /DNA_END=456 /DNA_ORIENTATION=-
MKKKWTTTLALLSWRKLSPIFIRKLCAPTVDLKLMLGRASYPHSKQTGKANSNTVLGLSECKLSNLKKKYITLSSTLKISGVGFDDQEWDLTEHFSR